MAKLNQSVKQNPVYTHEGTKAYHLNPELELRRSVMACLLWEGTFYENGVDITGRIANLIPKVSPQKVADMAIEARERMKLRHMPLYITRCMAGVPSHKGLVADTLSRVIQRADELAEFLAIYWKDKRQPLSAQIKKGLAQAFTKFDAYQLAKYNRDEAIKLRDVLFLCHAKPKDKEQEAIWKQLIAGTLPTPYTWEVELSAGKDKKESFERLIKENKLGGLALLRNLRNMVNAGVDMGLIQNALNTMKVDRILPFRFVTAARYAPSLEPSIEQAMMKCLASQEKLSGKTVLLVDVSGSMVQTLSDKGDYNRIDVAAGLAILIREIADARIFTFSSSCVEVPARHGFALRDAVLNSQPHGNTMTGAALNLINSKVEYDRIIVITDEQSQDAIPNPKAKGYFINVSCNQNGIGYGDWLHIDGWSEAVIDYIREFELNERSNANGEGNS